MQVRRAREKLAAPQVREPGEETRAQALVAPIQVLTVIEVRPYNIVYHGAFKKIIADVVNH